LVSVFTGKKSDSVRTAVGLFRQRIKEIMKQAGLPLSLKKISTDQGKFGFIARQSLMANSTQANPRHPSEADILSLLNQVYE
jgi:alcohol dehydrogenase class IV